MIPEAIGRARDEYEAAVKACYLAGQRERELEDAARAAKNAAEAANQRMVRAHQVYRNMLVGLETVFD